MRFLLLHEIKTTQSERHRTQHPHARFQHHTGTRTWTDYTNNTTKPKVAHQKCSVDTHFQARPTVGIPDNQKPHLPNHIHCRRRIHQQSTTGTTSWSHSGENTAQGRCMLYKIKTPRPASRTCSSSAITPGTVKKHNTKSKQKRQTWQTHNVITKPSIPTIQQSKTEHITQNAPPPTHP